MAKKAVAHFSCGSTSAVAVMLAFEEYGKDNVEIMYADPGAEHPDNHRFLKDCEEMLFKKKVTVVRSKKYKHIREIFMERKFLASPQGAPCTTEMKKIPIRDYLGERIMTEDQILGFDSSEVARAVRWRANNPESTLRALLIEKSWSKSMCLEYLDKRKIQLPAMYLLGFPNANCMGCVKAENQRYWSLVREKFPDVFDWYAKFERTIGKKVDGVPRGAAINKKYIKGVRHRLFLDELPENIKTTGMLPDFHCGYSCGADDEPEQGELDMGDCDD